MKNGVWMCMTPEQKAAEKALLDKAEMAMKAIVKDFKKKYIQEPNPDYGYISDYAYKFTRGSFYLEQTYKYDSLEAIFSERVVKVARLDFYADNTCGLSYMRHTGKWFLMCSGESLETCIDLLKTHHVFHG